MSNKFGIQAVIFDWAGTLVDFGCVAPVRALKETFEEMDISLTTKQMTQYMGLPKLIHIKNTLEIPEVASLWKSRHGKYADEDDIAALYCRFEAIIYKYLEEYSVPIPGSIELVDNLRSKGIKIGSTTGYTRAMTDVVQKAAKTRGLTVDCCITPDAVKAGRPYPWMCYMNAMELNVYPTKAIIKVGDTLSDIREGKNAGMWSVGVVNGGNELGLTKDELDALTQDEYDALYNDVKARYISAGADYVIRSIADLEEVIENINTKALTY